MHLIDLLAPSRVRVGVSVTSKKRLLETLARLLADGHDEAFERQIFDSLCGREKLGSTGLGQGIAIPHGRTAGLGTAIGTVVRLAEPVDFGASDGQPVDLLFALAVPEHFTDQHLQLLSQLAEMFSDSSFTARLRASASADELLGLLSDWRLAHAAA
ncbi:MAG: PTS IIA-like nitrogen regulatory protein PtsN [Lysobacteraceae bacterium]